MKSLINFISGTLLTTVAYFLGGWDTTLEILLVMIALDYGTGILKAIHNKKLSSEIGAKGIVKKVGYLIIVAVAVMLDKIIGDTGTIRNIVIFFFVANEGISLVENWIGMGLPIPKVIGDTLEQIKNKGGKE